VELTLERFSYAKSETEGVLRVDDFALATIERPWIPHTTPGGKPFESCVPDGEYILEPWMRPKRHKRREVYILYNPDLGVFKTEESRPNGVGRYLVLIHVANFARNVVGCIGPGMQRSLLMDKKIGAYARAVSSSGEAMRVLNSLLGREGKHRLTIRSVTGTGGEVV